jgi:N-methylhydantoinase A
VRRLRIGIDTGGTFTDCVYLRDGRWHILKLFSTRENPGAAVLDSVRAIAAGESPAVRHGTTVGTNTVLERTGARVAFVTTAGFEDTIAIGRQARAHLYDWLAAPPQCIVVPEMRFGVRERTTPEGCVACRPSQDELDELREKVRASGAGSIAISLLFSFANPENEIRVAESLRVLGLPLSISHQILPEFREYERASTVSMNAYLAPKMGAYLRSVESGLAALAANARFDVMQSSGGIVPAGFAAEQPVRTVLSGPAGGVVGAYLVSKMAGFHKIIAFDMGGTSTDVCLLDAAEAEPRITNELLVANMPVSIPMLDIHTVGSGGGSIACFDGAGFLHVGPESAGSHPGPICYGHGVRPTVSDANLILGRLRAEHFLGGEVRLEEQRTRHYMELSRGPTKSIEAFAVGIVMLAETAMEQAIRVISVERGYDPREFALVAFGGTGPLHACALAKALHIPRVLIPAFPGALSAIGILLADTIRDYSRTVMLPPHADVEKHLRELELLGAQELGSEAASAETRRSLDLRYVGQGYELNVPAGVNAVPDFHQAHRKRYGYADESRPVEIVNVRVRMIVKAGPVTFPQYELVEGDGSQALVESGRVFFNEQSLETAIYDRDRLRAGDKFGGPAIVVEYSATTVIPPACAVTVDGYRNLVIEVA